MRFRYRALPLFALLSAGCSLSNDGLDPVPGALNFPIALELTSDDATLFVANANFDLRYNAGSLQAFDVARIEERLGECATQGDQCIVPTEEALISEVYIGSHTSALALSPEENRVYLAVRSDTNLTYVDWSGRELNCGGNGPHRCTDAFRRGDESIATERSIILPSDPVGLAVGTLSDLAPDVMGDFVLMAHRSGEVSLFLDRADGMDGTAPALVHLVSDLPPGSSNVRFDQQTDVAWVPSSATNEIGRVGIAIDATSHDALRSFAFDAGSIRVQGLDGGDGGADIRDIEFDPDGRHVYILLRIPQVVAVVDLSRATSRSVPVSKVIPVGVGPSRLELIQLPVGDGTQPVLLATDFDSRDAYVLDPVHGTLLAVARGLGGPFELAFHQESRLLYVGDFRNSTIRVMSLDPVVACLEHRPENGTCEPSLVGLLGKPYFVGELQ